MEIGVCLERCDLKAISLKTGLAGPEILDTYSKERQPIGADVTIKANTSLRHYTLIWDALTSHRSPATFNSTLMAEALK